MPPAVVPADCQNVRCENPINTFGIVAGTRGVTIHWWCDTMHIAIHDLRYDTNRDTQTTHETEWFSMKIMQAMLMVERIEAEVDQHCMLHADWC